jgi:hypothetical protein
MATKPIDELIRLLAAYFTGPDVPLNEAAKSIKKGGKYQLHERAERFFAVREQLGIKGWATAEEARAALCQKLRLRSTE